MDGTIIAAFIGAAGSIVAAFIAAAQDKSRTLARTMLSGFLLWILLVAVLVGGLIALVLYDGTYHRIKAALPVRQGFQQVIYPRVGLGFSIPARWKVDDASFRFGGGDIDLIRDYDPSAQSIAQGIKFRLMNVQETYVNDPAAEYGNEEEALRQDDPHVTTTDVTLGGLNGKRFIYAKSSGHRLAYLERTWVHLTSRVKLEVFCLSNLDEASRKSFSDERARILESVVIDKEKVSELSKSQ